MSHLEFDMDRENNPVDMVEQVAAFNDWNFERDSDDGINICVKGVWAEYNVSFSWMADFEALHLACVFDLKVPEARNTQTNRLLALINEQMLIGHFDVWQNENTVMYRQALLLNGGAEPTDAQLHCLIQGAVEACERYFQAFQFVTWAGYDADQALDSALFETVGNA